MIMIKKSNLKLLILSHFFSVIILCVVGCYFIYSTDLTVMENRKFAAEILIFLSIITTTVNIGIVIFSNRNNIKLYNELDKLATFCRTHDIREGANQLRQLDKLGKKMNLIFDLINETGEKRKQKLASMYQIIDYLMINSDKNILITNVIGDIQFCSHKFSTVTKIDSDLIRTYRISDLLEISINQILSDFERKKTTDIALKNQILKFDDTSKKIKEVHILPIFDSDNIVSNMIFLFNFS
ncbi:MAG: hypothetical protein II258_01015 [Spirochaetales bacterium]|nr:hypothetical protein [Spirochaetales bacterium]